MPYFYHLKLLYYVNFFTCFFFFYTEDGYEQFQMAEKAHGSWMKLYVEGNTSVVLSNMAKKVLKQYLEALQAMSAALSKQLGKYDMYSMMVGMSLILQVIIRVIFLLFSIKSRFILLEAVKDIWWMLSLMPRLAESQMAPYSLYKCITYDGE